VNPQPAWTKPAARSVAARARRKTRRDLSCPDGGGTRRAPRIFRMVEAAIRCPGRRGSPWIVTTPHRVFSRASRKISATSSSGTGGRPGGFGWRHLAATGAGGSAAACPVSRSDGTRSARGRIRASAAATAVSLHDSRSLGFARHSTAISCRSARISASLDAGDRASSASQEGAVTSSPIGECDTPGVDGAGAVVQGQARWQSFRPAQGLDGISGGHAEPALAAHLGTAC
jgi:hypothetical protein